MGVLKLQNGCTNKLTWDSFQIFHTVLEQSNEKFTFKMGNTSDIYKINDTNALL